ncbi:MAG: hypothetical protein Q8N47_16985 [Bryobacterales bacterium]|nr:hypothetical protein [Bryobacterales bacterium]
MEQEQTAGTVRTPGFQEPPTANEFIEKELHRWLREIEVCFSAHALGLNGPLVDGVDDFLRTAVEKRRANGTASDKLVVILTTEGGYIETVQRMVDTVRRHYRLVDFAIPNQAFSAGTIFAMSGDAIYMDYYSRLGPIDPQVETQSGKRISALGYLERYNDLLAKAQDPKTYISTAEVNLLVNGFDQGELYHYEQAREQSIALLEEWLVKFKFKNWGPLTEERKLPVTDKMKKARAKKIGKDLNNTKKWHSHGHGISMEVLRRDLNVRIDDFEKDAERSRAIRGYHTLLSDYMVKRGVSGTIHIDGDYRSFL